MATYRDSLPQLNRTCLTDGGLETTLVFLEGVDLPCFAAFPLLSVPDGRDRLARYFQPYLQLARRHRVGFVLDTPTWRANPDWAARLGIDAAALAAVNAEAVGFASRLRDEHASTESPVVVNGVIGPRGDGYVSGEPVSVEEMCGYHGLQMRAFRDSGADMVSAITMTSSEEGIGIALAARECGMPVVISFTVETDGRLPSGTSLGEAVEATDRATDGYPAYYMVNCAHPDHFESVLASGKPWLDRLGGVRANASRKSHAELDSATELDIGDPRELARDYARLQSKLPRLRVLGGCCGTDHRHLEAICEVCLPGRDCDAPPGCAGAPSGRRPVSRRAGGRR